MESKNCCVSYSRTAQSFYEKWYKTMKKKLKQLNGAELMVTKKDINTYTFCHHISNFQLFEANK